MRKMHLFEAGLAGFRFAGVSIEHEGSIAANAEDTPETRAQLATVW